MMASHGVIGLYLPLYLVMLAFFVMLTASGTFDKARGADVLRSVSGAFASAMPILRGRFEGHALPLAYLETGSATRIEQVLADFDPSAARVLTRQGAFTMHTEMSALFQDQDIRFEPERGAMLARLADSISKVPGAQVTFLLGDRDPLARERAVFLDDHWPLIAPGTPAAIGLVPGDSGLTIKVDVPNHL